MFVSATDRARYSDPTGNDYDSAPTDLELISDLSLRSLSMDVYGSS
jgi:hypothetical protein